jgi:uncharacterized protein (DUF1684 family)
MCFLLFAGSAPPQDDSASFMRTIEMIRQQRNDEMAKGNELLDADKKNFGGLHYFPVDLKYRFTLRLQNATKIELVSIIASDGRQRPARVIGFFEFTIDSTLCRLYVYRLSDVAKKYPKLLFIPFTDGTSGRESYGGGRYIDLTEQDHDDYVVDFNLAYNPSCAYGKTTFSCPIPPPENNLRVRIPAGEKKWKH